MSAITEDEREQILRLTRSGMSDVEIAEQIGRAVRTVWRTRKKAGVPGRPGRPPSPHGTSNRYTSGCRCESCRDARRDYIQNRREAARTNGPPEGIVHGLSAAFAYGCRCSECKSALDARSLAERADDIKRQYSTNQESLTRARRHGQQWTGPELEIVAREDLTVAQQAELLGRSYYATRAMRRMVRNDPKVARLAGLDTDVARAAQP